MQPSAKGTAALYATKYLKHGMRAAWKLPLVDDKLLTELWRSPCALAVCHEALGVVASSSPRSSTDQKPLHSGRNEWDLGGVNSA